MKRVYFVLGIIVCTMLLTSCSGKKEAKLETAKAERGTVKAVIASTGIVTPRNRLEIKPQVSGRIEEILVSEGDKVKKGQIIAWVSSNERAALLDAARSKGIEEYKHWMEIYKAAPIMAPLNGFIILRGTEPGQSVTVSDPIVVMADHLIVKAQVDETDLAKIHLRQKTSIILDAYQDKPVDGIVEHIAYESETINNVTIYKVDILPQGAISLFRSGMSATVNFLLSEKKNALLLPVTAVKKVRGKALVFVKSNEDPGYKTQEVTTGVESTDKIEITSGLSDEAEVIIPTAKMALDAANPGHRSGPMNPFSGNRTR